MDTAGTLQACAWVQFVSILIKKPIHITIKIRVYP